MSKAKFLIELTRKAICPKCGKEYTMGYDGITGGCDACMGVQRDPYGWVWLPGETEKENPLTGDSITREQAFQRKP